MLDYGSEVLGSTPGADLSFLNFSFVNLPKMSLVVTDQLMLVRLLSFQLPQNELSFPG